MIIIQFILLFLQSMKNKKKQIIPAFATHPGELIKDELVERKMTQKELAKRTGIKPSILSETINGKRSISLSVAVALEKAFGIPTQYWMNLQTQYNIDSAKIAEKDNQHETIAVTIPVSDRNLLRDLAYKFGWACVL
jgi:addiction module HigA family antidote